MAQDAPDVVPEALAVILRNAQAQKVLLERRPILSRILTGRLDIVRKPTDLWHVALNALQRVRQNAAAREVTITLRAPEQVLPVVALLTRISSKQAICEVLDNAVNSTPNGGSITVQGRQAQEHGELLVHDSGQGISTELLSQLSLCFNGNAGKEIGGLGIGLALTHGIIEAHGGNITITSAGPGQGTTVTLSLHTGKRTGWRQVSTNSSIIS